MDNYKVIPPGSKLGMLGDGQLGWMTIQAANELGYQVAVLGPGGRDSSAGRAARWATSWGPDPATVSNAVLDEFCEGTKAVMVEWENVPVDLTRRIEARGVPVRPNERVLSIAQDRLHEKRCAERLRIQTPLFLSVDSPENTKDIFESPTILKTRRNGYDGRGQIRIPAGDSIDQAWEQLGRVPCILESVVNFACEVSVIAARFPALPEKDRVKLYGPFQNRHEGGILQTTHSFINLPDPLRTEVVYRTRHATQLLSETLDVHGLLAVEFFVDDNGNVLFNEMAPRPHNSGHLTLRQCRTSQFHQYVRSVCNLPPGSMETNGHWVMENILGHEIDNWPTYLTDPDASLYHYGKSEARDGRKMGHVLRPWKSPQGT